MRITRTSPLTGELNTLNLPIDRLDLDRWRHGDPAINLLGRLNSLQRDFFLSGFMPGEHDVFYSLPPSD